MCMNSLSSLFVESMSENLPKNLFITAKLILCGDFPVTGSLDHMPGSRSHGSSGTYVTNRGETRHRYAANQCSFPVQLVLFFHLSVPFVGDFTI